MQILGMHFDAVIVEVEKYLLFSDWLWPYCVPLYSPVSIKNTVLRPNWQYKASTAEMAENRYS